MLNLLFGFLLSFPLIDLGDTVEVKKNAPIYSVLEEEKTVTVLADYTVKEVSEKTITVLSQEGLRHARVVLFYDNLVSIKDFELEMIEPLTGKTIKKARLRDMSDYASNSTSFLLDNRYKFYEPSSPRYPVIIKIRTEILKNNNFYYSDWYPINYLHQKVTKSSLDFVYPTELGLKFKEVNLEAKTKTEVADGITTNTWQVEDLEVLTPSYDQDKLPKLLLAPVKFSIGEFQGEMNDWAGLGMWQSKLNAGRGQLPEDFQQQILQMIQDLDTPYEKIEVLYEYLQRNFRYVSIQLGIGGWQTMTAQEVLENKYGDCKALTNLMKSMLEVAGIPSFYTLVYAGVDEEDIEVDLPSNQFNHVILQVPTDSGPIWLECTSTLNPPGYLGDFTSNRHVLVTTPEGGYLTKTPAYQEDHWNKILTKTNVTIDDQGGARIESTWTTSGDAAMRLREVNSVLDDREKRDYLNRNSAVAGLIVGEYAMEMGREDSLPTATIRYSGLIQRFTQGTSKRLILRPFLTRVSEGQLSGNILSREDSYTISLPENFELEGGDSQEISIEGSGYEGKLSISKSGKDLEIFREISIQLDREISEEQRTSLFKEINGKFDRTLTFLKSSLSSNSYE
ncbi:DUF3857 domain-containing protein [Algoriphagus sanaruensis]|uniref:DUF3857 domain-containing protein n=1 Tax=Algoriphagus sanaruensis TaxID=1727163 RepID=A0A142EJ45_9BACT|nr:DUF3857 domain-containing protein [Algoriphagus sanaruensis]AMQ55150.1 hypothetical protein AO498_01995 [Algoriphagus sanaruensis]